MDDASNRFFPLGQSARTAAVRTSYFLNPPTAPSTTFSAGADDIPPINVVRDFFKEYMVESKKLWFLAGPAIFTSICQYSLGAITQVFSGQVGTLTLAAVSVQKAFISGFSFGIMLGMGSALETLCGQAFGVGQLDMLGKLLQAQRKMMATAVISGVALVLHVVLSWVLMFKLGWGLVGAAIVLNMSWIFIDMVQFLYIISGTCGPAWIGFSWKAFHHLWGFVKLSLASAIMLCLEIWYFMSLILSAGYLKDAEVSVDALSIWRFEFCCMNIPGWTAMISIGMNAGIRVSNELRAGHPRTVKFSLVVTVTSSFMIGVIISLILIIFRTYPEVIKILGNYPEVIKILGNYPEVIKILGNYPEVIKILGNYPYVP
ncbi:pfkB-type carbohydrate kinase family protein [Hibiscus syriacus]|uniref:PfkB-type carbohydrate kinase family protein n=1 Tax=Hibiscus syriacus TaxID=106335 RepID=A0A6A3CSM4_HIBSY|nr:pfkB-type carbohydrate kinase family protein [Hibiscus syriacus]